MRSACKRVIDAFLPVLLAVGWVASAAGSSAWLGQAWQTDEGLPDNGVTGLAQTPDGYLWVAGLGGLVRFNGAKFEEFSPLNLGNIPNRVVRAMLLDRSNRFWLAMDRRVLVCVSSNSVQTFTAEDGLPNWRVTALAEDREGTLWAAYGPILCGVRDGKLFFPGEREGLPSGGAVFVATDAQGDLWCLKGGGLSVFREGRFRPAINLGDSSARFTAAKAGGLWVYSKDRVLKFDEPDKLQEHARLPTRALARVLFEDRDGALWIGTAAHGLFRYRTGQLEHVPTSHPEISCLAQDHEGNLWAGTMGSGINRIRARVLEMLGPDSGLPMESMRSVSEGPDGSVWVVTQSGLLARGDGALWTNVTAVGEWRGRNATCVNVGQDGTVWLGTADRGLIKLGEKDTQTWNARSGLASDSVRSVLASARGPVWIATDTPHQVHVLREGKIQRLNLPSAVRSIRAMAEDTNGVVWIGTADGQLLRAEKNELKLVPATRESRPLSIRYLQTTPDGSLWIGYAGWGLGRFNDGKYTRLTMTDGLHDDYVCQLLPDPQGRLWFSSNHGIFQTRLSELEDRARDGAGLVRSVVFGRGEGVRSLQGSFEYFPSAWAGRDGRLWFCQRSGLAVAYPSRLVDNPHPPTVVLERVTVDNRTVAVYDSGLPLRGQEMRHAVDLRHPRERLRLPPGHRRIEIDFAALSFTSPENVRFRYRLSQFDDDWIEAGTHRSATYPRLPAGRYSFQVRACNNAGVWNETGIALNLEVTPFFWQTWWFRLGALGLFTAGLVGSVRYFSFRRLQRKVELLERQAALQRERARIARDMHDEVGAKLSRLSLLGEMAGRQPDMPPEARSEVEEISETARETIRSFEEIVWAVNPKNDSLSDLAQYLCRYAEEFFDGSTVECAFDLPAAIPDLPVPTEARHQVFLAAKEALNNVLKHAGATRVCVRVNRDAEGFEICIEDNGRGFDSEGAPPGSGSGNGLGNMEERMRAVNGVFSLQSRPGGGTQVRLRVPFAVLRQG